MGLFHGRHFDFDKSKQEMSTHNEMLAFYVSANHWYVVIYTCHLNHENTSTVCVTLHTRANFDVWRWMRCWRCDGCYFWRCGFQRNQRIFLTCIGTVSSHVCGNKTAYFWWDIETVSSHVCNNRIQSPGKMILSATLMKWFLSRKPNQSISSSFCQNICKVSTYPWFV